MRWFAVGLMMACGTVDGVEAPPPTQSLTLSATPYVPGQRVTWTVDGLLPGEQVTLLRGIDTTFDAGGCPGVLGGLCLDVVPPLAVVDRAMADASGVARITRRLPAGLPVGDGIGVQAIARRGPGGADSTKSQPVYARFENAMTLTSPNATPSVDPACDLDLPVAFACSGGNPELRWTDVPRAAVSLLFLADDLATGAPTYALWNVPATASGVPAGVSGTGGWLFPFGIAEDSSTGGPWVGPCPSGSATRWRLVALDALPRTVPGATFEDRFDALEAYARVRGISSVSQCVR